MASTKAVKKASKSMPSKKEEGTVWVSPDGILYTEPKIDADLLKKSRENKYIVEGLGKQQRLIFRKGLKVELIDHDNDDKADEKESKFLMTMVRKPDVALHNKIQLLWKDAMEFGCGPYNDAWADTDDGYVMTKLQRLPPETFENCGASTALVYNRILQGIRWNHETKKTEYWQTQADGTIVELTNCDVIVDPLCGEIGGTPYIIPLVPFVNMLRFLWNKKMQEANIYGAGGLYFIKVKNPQGDDTEFAQKILNNESGDVRFQLRENMDLVVITVSGTGVAIEGIQEAQSQVQTFFSASNLIQKDGTLIGGSSQPEFDLFMAYLESTHRWLEEAVRKMLLPYLKGNGFAPNWDIKVTIPDLEYDKSQTLLSAVSSAFTTKSITLAERRKVYEKVGIETKDMTPEEEKALLDEYAAQNSAPVMSPMLQKVEAMAKVISATPLDPHAFIHQGKMEEAIDALDTIDSRGDKKGLPFLQRQMTRESQQSKPHSHGGEGSGRYPKGSGGNKPSSSSKPLSMKTMNMDQSTQPKSTLEKQSREIIKAMPPKEEWANPRGREIAELAAMAHGTGMTTDVATNDTDGFEGIIAHYNDADGVNITYLASVGKTKGVGSDLLKKVIEANPGKDINLFADPGAVTYYQHIGMEQLSGDEEKGGVFRWAAKDAKAFADKGTEKINKALDGIFEHGGPGSGRYPAGSGDNNVSLNIKVPKTPEEWVSKTNDIWESNLDDDVKANNVVDKEETRAKIRDTVKAFVDKSDVRVRVPITLVDEIIKDGELENQFSSKRSMGTLSKEARGTFEEKVFGIPKNTKGEGRPIYGYLSNPDVPDSETGVDMYGEVAFVLKDEARGRSTFTMGDSLDATMAGSWHSCTPAPVLNADEKAFPMYDHNNKVNDRISKGGYERYAEAQIHGGVKISDIKKAVIYKDKIFTAVKSSEAVDKAARSLAKAGIEVEIR